VVVSGAGLSKPHATFDAQPRAVFLASRRERQRENQGISKDRLKIEQVPVQRVPVLTTIPAVLLITEKFLAPDRDRLGHGFEAPRALTRHGCRRADRGEHALGDRLEPDLKVQVGAFGNVGHAGVEVRRCRRGQYLGPHRSRAAVNAPGIKNQRPARVRAGAGCPSG
jgi:hypothetical protein